MHGISLRHARLSHRWIGAGLLLAVIVHVGALWITSPPDVVDALFFVSPTPFSAWGVIAMWAVFASALLAILRRHIRLRLWRTAHQSSAVIIVTGTIVHALQIDGTMEPVSKVALCTVVALATGLAIAKMLGWKVRNK